jgi:hypothetical protein
MFPGILGKKCNAHTEIFDAKDIIILLREAKALSR